MDENGKARKKRLSGMHEAKSNASLASRVLCQLSKCIHNLIDPQAWTTSFRILPQPLYSIIIRKNARKLTKYKILLKRSECFYWLCMHLSRFRCELGRALQKKHAKLCQFCPKYIYFSTCTDITNGHKTRVAENDPMRSVLSQLSGQRIQF